MRLFSSSSSNSGQHRPVELTTKDLFLGYPEAEAEISESAKIKLREVFEDYLDVLPKLDGPQFIVSGRKGSGKSAIGEHIALEAKKAGNANTFVQFVRQSDINFEKLLQAAEDAKLGIDSTTLLEWLILVRFCSKLAENELLQSELPLKDLKKFFDKNRGLVSLGSLELKSLVETAEGQVSVGVFSRAIMAILSRRTEFKNERAPFYKLIPHLKDAFLALLRDTAIKEHGVEYLLIFDDLDVGLNRDDASSMTRLAALLRLCRDYNKIFGDESLSAKIIILLREDIAKELSETDADMGKIIQSYSVRLSWYGGRIFGPSENDAEIKRFIAKRIAVSLGFTADQFDVQKAWDAVVYKDDRWGIDNSGRNRTSFKYILDYTLYRPRDLILFFADVDKLKFKLPLSKQEIDETLVPNYANRLVTEWSNELLFVLSKGDRDLVIQKLRAMVYAGLTRFTLTQFARQFEGCQLTAPPEFVLRKLFEYSIIGEIDDKDRLSFTHRQDAESPIEFNPQAAFTFQRAFLAYGNNRYKGQ